MIAWRTAYPFVVMVGLFLSYIALRSRYKKGGMNQEQRVAVGLAAFTGAMIGSKLPFLFDVNVSLNSWVWLADGKTILGGILGGYLAVEVVKPFVSITERTGDHFAIPVAIAVAFGRLGCFVSGCCFGEVTDVPWGIEFPSARDEVNVLRHPTQLYEATFHGLAVLVLRGLELKDWFHGRRLTLYLGSYLVYRFVSEWIRPEPDVMFGLTIYQLACILLALLLIVAEIIASRRASRSQGMTAL